MSLASNASKQKYEFHLAPTWSISLSSFCYARTVKSDANFIHQASDSYCAVSGLIARALPSPPLLLQASPEATQSNPACLLRLFLWERNFFAGQMLQQEKAGLRSFFNPYILYCVVVRMYLRVCHIISHISLCSWSGRIWETQRGRRRRKNRRKRREETRK